MSQVHIHTVIASAAELAQSYENLGCFGMINSSALISIVFSKLLFKKKAMNFILLVDSMKDSSDKQMTLQWNPSIVAFLAIIYRGAVLSQEFV